MKAAAMTDAQRTEQTANKKQKKKKNKNNCWSMSIKANC